MEMKVIATVLMLFVMASPVFAADSEQAAASVGVKQARMSQEQVIEVAKAFAIKEGKNLSEYQESSARYDETHGEWSVFFDGKPKSGVYIVGNHFSIEVDDKSGKAERLFGGL
jgi:acid phosphatase class B